MQYLRLICLILIASLSSILLGNSAAAGQDDRYSIQNTSSKDWICSLPVISFMGNKFEAPIKMRLKNGPVRVQALQLWGDKEGLYNTRLVSFRNETNKSVTAVKLALTLFTEDAPETVLQRWESDPIVFRESLVEWRSIIDATRPHQISQGSLERSQLKDNFELGSIRLRRIFQKESKSAGGNENQVIEVRVSQIIYEDGTIWGRN
jgi:hypothetical protein